jgi:1-deoxy-D-xylulose-5-phosphate reductoisomerase
LRFFYPNRVENSYKSLSLFDIGKLTFEKADTNIFKCLRLAFDSLKIKGTMPAVLNAANETAVDLFLNKKISFLDIGNINENVMLKHSAIKIDSVETILEVEEWTKKIILEQF